MRRQELAELVRRTPFQPFTLHLSNGDTFPVQHLDFFVVPPESFHTAFWYAVTGNEMAIIDLWQIAAVRLQEESIDTEES